MTNKTQATKKSVAEYIRSLDDPTAMREAKILVKLFSEVTGTKPKLWGSSIIGFGEYHYKYDSGREGDFLATGFSMRKSGPTIYIMPGYSNYPKLMEKIGPHKLGKSCLYLKNLDNVHLPTLKKLIKAGLKDLNKKYSVVL